MSSLEEKIIELSKTKIMSITFFSFVFICAGFWLAYMNEAAVESSRRFNDPLFVHGLGWVAIVFGLLGCIFSIKKVFDKRPGLILNSVGIFDNSSAVSAGLIPWCDIADFGIYEVHKQKMPTVILKNPDKYVEIGSSMRKTLNRANFKLCGSPIAITSTSLKISFDELVKVASEYLAKYGSST